jgi:hypothetical protein
MDERTDPMRVEDAAASEAAPGRYDSGIGALR